MIIDHTIPGNESRANYRDVALFFQDEDNIIGTSFMPYVQNVAGLTGVNYRSNRTSIAKSRGARSARCSSLAKLISQKILPRRSLKRMRAIPCAFT